MVGELLTARWRSDRDAAPSEQTVEGEGRCCSASSWPREASGAKLLARQASNLTHGEKRGRSTRFGQLFLLGVRLVESAVVNFNEACVDFGVDFKDKI